MYIITARRITLGELFKERKVLPIAESYGTILPGLSPFALALPYSLPHSLCCIIIVLTQHIC